MVLGKAQSDLGAGGRGDREQRRLCERHAAAQPLVLLKVGRRVAGRAARERHEQVPAVAAALEEEHDECAVGAALRDDGRPRRARRRRGRRAVGDVEVGRSGEELEHSLKGRLRPAHGAEALARLGAAARVRARLVEKEARGAKVAARRPPDVVREAVILDGGRRAQAKAGREGAPRHLALGRRRECMRLPQRARGPRGEAVLMTAHDGACVLGLEGTSGASAEAARGEQHAERVDDLGGARAGARAREREATVARGAVDAASVLGAAILGRVRLSRVRHARLSRRAAAARAVQGVQVEPPSERGLGRRGKVGEGVGKIGECRTCPCLRWSRSRRGTKSGHSAPACTCARHSVRSAAGYPAV